MRLTHTCPNCGKEHEMECTPEPDRLCPDCEKAELERAFPEGQGLEGEIKKKGLICGYCGATKKCICEYDENGMLKGE